MNATIQTTEDSSRRTTMFAITFNTLVNGRRATGSFELDFDRATRKQIVRDILEGQYDGVDQVFEFDAIEGICADVTGDIAMDCAEALFDDGSKCPDHLRDWIAEHYDVYGPDRIDFASGEVAA